MRKILGTVLASLLLATSVSMAKQHVQPASPTPPPKGLGRFMGSHPLAGRPDAGFCYIDVPHVHDYLPDRSTLYQQTSDGYVFSGDPVPFGYDGQKTVYYGHHPIPVEAEPVVAAAAPPFCFMKGPHYHEYPQPEAPGFKIKDSVVFYVGPIPPPVAAVRPQLEQAIEVEYRPYVALRPKVVVEPPPEWMGVVWVAPPPSTVVVAPSPTVVVAPSPTVVVAPAPPAVIIAPIRPAVIVAPPVFFMGGHKGKGKGWHGNGKGKGHWKHW